jgi:S1-C subfamily serine protease
VLQPDRSIRHFSMPVIDTDSYGQRGGSGSPGFNKRGRAVGVVFAVSELPELTGARTSVVPIVYALRLIEKNRARLLRPESK